MSCAGDQILLGLDDLCRESMPGRTSERERASVPACLSLIDWEQSPSQICSKSEVVYCKATDFIGTISPQEMEHSGTPLLK